MNELLRRAKLESSPLLDDERVTFVWRGKRAPMLVGDFNDWDERHALRLRERARRVWTRTLTFPRDAYMEYTFVLNGKRAFDPFNPRLTPNGIGDTNNFFYMPGAAPTELIQRGRAVPRGVITAHRIETQGFVAGHTRTVHLYRPPVKGRSPLLVVLDGQDYLRRGKLATIVDNLIAHKRIRPLALAFVENSRAARSFEYGCSDLQLVFLLQKVLPLARQQLDLINTRGAHGILGASLGGLEALYVGLRAPQVFGLVMSQSGSFHPRGFDSVLIDLVKHTPKKEIKIWMDAGRYEWLLEPNRAFYRLLRAKNYDVTYHEFNAGHNYPAWRDDLGRGLEEMFAN